MPVIETRNPDVVQWQGLHLFHYAMSNCSQRVRMCLEEKDATWKSHHLDLSRNEHVTDWYQSINPNGVVPTLVHNGRVVIESVDIIDYLDRTLPKPPLAPHDRAGYDALAELANARQTEIKLLSHEFLFKPVRRLGRKELERFRANVGNKTLVDFHERFHQGFEATEVQTAIDRMHEAMDVLEKRLARGNWLDGEQFSLADITWAVNVHRLSLMRFPFDAYPRVSAWMRRLEERPSYQRALRSWEPKTARIFFAGYSLFRRATGGKHLQRSL